MFNVINFRLLPVLVIRFSIGSIFFCSFLQSSNFDYIYKNYDVPSYSNYGTIGLIQMPTARMHPAGTIAFSWSHNDPYISGSILAYPFSFFEASYSYTDINNALYSDVEAFSGGQSYKDKGFDFKIKLLNETDFLPDLAVGFRDLAGTAIFSSEFLVATKKIFNIDFSAGIGWGVLNGNNIKNPLSYFDKSFNFRSRSGDTLGGEFDIGTWFKGQAGIFGGIEYVLPNLNGTRIKIEYDGTNYKKEGFPYGRESFKFAFEPVKQPDSNINFGVVYPVNKYMQFKLSYVKGNTLNFGFSIKASLGGKNPIFKKDDPIKDVENQNEVKYVNSLDELYLYRNTIKYLDNNQFYVQKADLRDDTYSIVYAQSKHGSHIRSTGRVATLLDQITPDEIKTFEIININAGMHMNKISVDREEFTRYQESEVSALGIKALDFSPSYASERDFKYNPVAKYPKLFWRIQPTVRSQIGGPDGFYFGDIRIQASSETVFARNITLISSASVGVVNNFDEIKLASDSVLPHVRTDIVKYLQESSDYNIKRLQLNVFKGLSNNIYSKLSAGFLEEMFGGYGGEILYRPFYKNYGIGAEVWRVRQRDYNMMLKFRDYETTTGHINLYYREPYSKILFSIKGGRFLAEDSGINFDFSRRFKSGLTIGAFFSRTDISKEEFGEGSFDKGFYFHLPIETFFKEYSKINTSWGLRPLTRDGASYLNHYHHLWGVTEQTQYEVFSRDFDDLYD